MILPIITVGIEFLVMMIEYVFMSVDGYVSLALSIVMIAVFGVSAIICGICIGYNAKKMKSNDGHKGKWVTGLVFSIVGTSYAAIFLTVFFATLAALS